MKIQEIEKIIEILPLTWAIELEMQTARGRIKIIKSPAFFNPSQIKIVRSSQVGLFQKKVHRGKRVKKGQVIGYLFILGFKEEIQSPLDGIVKSCSKSGGVEYNQPLFEIIEAGQ